jgi:hypothetical protein
MLYILPNQTFNPGQRGSENHQCTTTLENKHLRMNTWEHDGLIIQENLSAP